MTLSGLGEHKPALDGLRGLAILLVVLHNAMPLPAGASGILWPISVIGSAGWIGVQLFFVLSGYLITAILLTTRSDPDYFRNFYARRALRILPLTLVTLFVGLVLLPMVMPGRFEPVGVDQIWLWLFLYNWVEPLGIPAHGFPHFWSLAVEEQFYLLWPFAVWKSSQRGLAALCIGLAILALVIRVALTATGADADFLYELTVCRMDAIALGGLIAVIVSRGGWTDSHASMAAALVPASIAVLLFAACSTWAFTLDNPVNGTLGYLLLGCGFSGIVLACVLPGEGWNGWLQRMLSASWLRMLGRYSFGIYVLHFPLAQGLPRTFFSTAGVPGSVAFLTLLVAASLVAAMITYHFLELPFLRLKTRFRQNAVNVPETVTHPGR